VDERERESERRGHPDLRGHTDRTTATVKTGGGGEGSSEGRSAGRADPGRFYRFDGFKFGMGHCPNETGFACFTDP